MTIVHDPRQLRRLDPLIFPIFLSNFSCLYGRHILIREISICHGHFFEELSRTREENHQTVKTAEIRQKNGQNQGVESPKLSGLIAVSSVKLAQFESSTFFSAIAESLLC